MAQFILLLIGALVVGMIVFGTVVLLTGNDGLTDVEPDGRSVPLPVARPLLEDDLNAVRFDTAIRGYRMSQVDQALRRAAYDIGYKSELVQVLEAEVTALRDGRTDEADALRAARETALAGAVGAGGASSEGGAQDAGSGEAGSSGDRGSQVARVDARGSAGSAGGAVADSPGLPATAPAAKPDATFLATEGGFS